MKQIRSAFSTLPRALTLALASCLPAAVQAQSSDGAAASIDEVVEAALSAQMTPGAVVAIVQGDSIAFLQAYGRTSFAADAAPLPEDALFRAAPATELVTALTATALAAAGRFSLDGRIGARVPAVPEELRDATIEQLLTHTGGLAHQVAVPGRGGADDLGAAARQLTGLDRLAQPGALYSTSTPGIMLAALAVQTFAGAPYAELVESAIFEPTGMNNSVVTTAAAVPGLTAGWVSSRTAATPVVAAEAAVDSAVNAPVRGFHTTAADLGRLAAAIMNDGFVAGERVLPAGAVRNLVRPRGTVPGSGAAAAAGPRITSWRDRPAILIQGGHSGHSVVLHLLPNEKLGVIVLANKQDARLTGVSDFVFARLLGLQESRPSQTQSVPPDTAILAALTAAAGRYINGSEVLEIVVEDGRPRLQSGDLVLDLVPVPGGAAGALLGGRIALTLRLVSDAQGNTYVWLGDRALARRE